MMAGSELANTAVVDDAGVALAGYRRPTQPRKNIITFQASSELGKVAIICVALNWLPLFAFSRSIK